MSIMLHYILLMVFLIMPSKHYAGSLDWHKSHEHLITHNPEGVSNFGSMGFSEQIADMMNRPAVVNSFAAQQKQVIRPKLSIQGRKNLAQHPRSEQIESDFLKSIACAGEARQITRTVQTVNLNFLATQYSESGFVPPDADGAVGLQQYLMVASGIVKTFNTSTGALDGVLIRVLIIFLHRYCQMAVLLAMCEYFMI